MIQERENLGADLVQIPLTFLWFSLNFPMVLPYLSYSLPLTFRSNKTIIHIIQQAATVLTDCFGNKIFNVKQA